MSGVPSETPVDKAQQTTAELAQRLGVTPNRAGCASADETDLIVAQGGGFHPLEEPTAGDAIALLRSSRPASTRSDRRWDAFVDR